jgi:hypothetical protein
LSGKDLLAVLAMIVPGILLAALIAFSLVPSSVMQPFPGSGVLRGDYRAQPEARRTLALREVWTGSAPKMATQKRMRNPWERPAYAKVP